MVFWPVKVASNCQRKPYDQRMTPTRGCCRCYAKSSLPFPLLSPLSPPVTKATAAKGDKTSSRVCVCVCGVCPNDKIGQVINIKQVFFAYSAAIKCVAYLLLKFGDRSEVSCAVGGNPETRFAGRQARCWIRYGHNSNVQ